MQDKRNYFSLIQQDQVLTTLKMPDNNRLYSQKVVTSCQIIPLNVIYNLFQEMGKESNGDKNLCKATLFLKTTLC